MKLSIRLKTYLNLNSQQEREQLINSLQGKYAHAPTSSEDFARQKQAEIDR